MDYDLVVIGCGAAGLSAAVSFADIVGPQARIAVLMLLLDAVVERCWLRRWWPTDGGGDT